MEQCLGVTGSLHSSEILRIVMSEPVLIVHGLSFPAFSVGDVTTS